MPPVAPSAGPRKRATGSVAIRRQTRRDESVWPARNLRTCASGPQAEPPRERRVLLAGLVAPAQVVEEGGDVAAEQAGFLGGWEVAAAGHRRLPADVVQPLGPLAGRRPVVNELGTKDSYRGGHGNRVGGTQFGGQPPVVRVVLDGGRDRLGSPVQGHHGEQEVAGEGGVDVPAGIGPAPPLFQHPGRQASGRVVEAVADRLRPRPLDRAVAAGRLPPTL